jgi:hypothetical protein
MGGGIRRYKDIGDGLSDGRGVRKYGDNGDGLTDGEYIFGNPRGR